MRSNTDPFYPIKQQEKELKRQDLYLDILKQLELKAEAYDDSAIGHEFVSQYEKQLPGIITASSGDHSFLNSSDEDNRRVIMEAVSGGMALKAGVVAAVLMIIYKIIRVVTNNPSFSGGGGGGGGRGTVSHVKAATEELRDAHRRCQEQLDKARELMPAVVNNPSSRDDTSPQYAAAVQVQTTYESQFNSSDDKKGNSSPFDIIKNIDLESEAIYNLPSFMVVKDDTAFDDFVNNMQLVVETLNKYSPDKLLDVLENIDTHLRSKPEFATGTGLTNVILLILRQMAPPLGVTNVEELLNSDHVGVDDNIKKMYILMIKLDYGRLLKEDPSEVYSPAEFVKDYADENGSFAKRSLKMAEFNEAFMQFLGSNKELEDSRFYSNLEHYSKNLVEFKAEVKENKSVANVDMVLRRVNLLISIVETYTKFLLANLCMLRRQTDKVDEFRKRNTEKMQKLAKALEDFNNAAAGEKV